MPTIQPLHAQLVEFYGRLGPPGDLTFWLKFAEDVGSRILYVGAGVGRRAIPMARAGVEILALEPDPAMLAALEAKLARETAEVRSRLRVLNTRVEESTCSDRFQGVMAPSALLNYAITAPRDQERFLHSCRRLTDDGGQLALELYNPFTLLQDGPLHVGPGLVGIDPDTWANMTIYRSGFDVWSQCCTNFSTVYDCFVPGEPTRRYINTSTSAVAIFPRELSMLLAHASFSLRSFVSAVDDREPQRNDLTFVALAEAR